MSEGATPAPAQVPGVDEDLGGSAGAWLARQTGSGATLAATVVSTSRAVPATKESDPVPFTTHVVLRRKGADANGGSSSSRWLHAPPPISATTNSPPPPLFPAAPTPPTPALPPSPSIPMFSVAIDPCSHDAPDTSPFTIQTLGSRYDMTPGTWIIMRHWPYVLTSLLTNNFGCVLVLM